ncbi:ankyrin repeat domain-containing protein 52 [Elysia marginata]|uniref:Ankyrin repeat domain-containing protein 52 n=1 Tax=Elysia marginata TaxID=1093978 RepID=A0AAV4GFM6_9GAST|nr:ankyrin repeat domain-containing protein 52 [Elysia marginata]
MSLSVLDTQSIDNAVEYCSVLNLNTYEGRRQFELNFFLNGDRNDSLKVNQFISNFSSPRESKKRDQEKGKRHEYFNMESSEILLAAVESQDKNKLRMLLDGIPGGASKTSLVNQLLEPALSTGHRDILEVLVTNGADLNSPIEFANSRPFQLHINLHPLEFAIVGGKIDTVSILLDLGADVNLDQNGRTPLCIACATAYFPAIGVRKLLEAGADCNKGSIHTPLQIAAHYGRPSVVKALLEYGADVRLADRDGNTSLALALWTPLSKFASAPLTFNISKSATSDQLRKDKLSCARLLLDAGSEVNRFNASEVSILQSVVLTPFVDKNVLSMLLSYGANPDAGDLRSGVTPLMTLANVPLKEAEDLIMLLLENGAAINKTDKIGNTALHYAASNNSIERVTFLIDNGAEINTTNNQNLNAMDKLSYQRYLELLPNIFGKGIYPSNVIIRRGTDFDSFITGCRCQLPATTLTLALCFGKTELAMHLREIGFLTKDDIKWLPGSTDIRDKLPLTAAETYDSVVTGPCPLTLMSFVKVSHLVGTTSDRLERVKQLRLPVFLQNRLLFKRPPSIGASRGVHVIRSDE